MWFLNKEWTDNDHGVLAAFKVFALEKLRYRWDWMTFDVHRASYALAPDFHDDNLFGNLRIMDSLRDIIRFFAPDDHRQGMVEFHDLKNTNDDDLFPRVDDAIKTGSAPKDWWQMYGARWPCLQQVAMRLFSIGTSSCASERNFSTWSHIWTHRANNLNFGRAVKLVYIYQNLVSFDTTNCKFVTVFSPALSVHSTNFVRGPGVHRMLEVPGSRTKSKSKKCLLLLAANAFIDTLI